MDHNNYPEDFENYLRRELQGAEARPDEEAWSQIAARQGRRNAWLKLRYYGPRGLGLALAVAVAVWVWNGWQAAPTEVPPPRAARPEGRPAAAGPVAEMPAPAWPEPALPPATESRAGHPWFSERPLARPVRASWYATNTVPVAQVRFLAGQGVQYRNPVSGNSVRIPPNVLVYADGRPVEGAVTLLFREYRGLADILASGIPMHYGDEKGQFFFNSAGMFEVRVSQDGEDLFVAPGKTYDVAFAPTGKFQDANWFYLPDSTDEWTHAHGQVLGARGASPLRAVTEEDAIRDNAAASNPACLPESWKEPEAQPVEYLREAIATGQQLARGGVQVPLWFRKNADKPDNFFLKGLERSDIRIVRQADGNEERFFPDDLKGVFTELAAFKNCYFVRLTDSTDTPWRPDPENSVDAIYRQGRTWKRVEVVPGTGWRFSDPANTDPTNCLVIFSDEKEEVHLPARLAKSNEAPQAAGFDPEEVFDEYQTLRRERHNSTITTLNYWRRFMMIADMFQTPDEWCMTTREWFDYFDRNRPQMLARYDSLYNAGLTTDEKLALETVDNWRARVRALQMARAEAESRNQGKERKLIATLRMTGFGTYNCDQIFQLAENPRFLVPRFQDSNGAEIEPSSIRIVERQTRLFFTFPGTERLLKMPGRELDVILTDANNRTYLLPGKSYAALNLDKAASYTFTMEDVTDKVGSPTAWADLLGI